MPLTNVRSLSAVRLLEPISGPKDYIAYWKFDEGYGNIAHDYSGNGNNGTIYGATWVDGVIGKALSFDGVDDYVEVPHSDSLMPSAFTVAVWFKVYNWTSQFARVLEKGGYTVGGGYGIEGNPNGDGKIQLVIWNGTASQTFETSTVLSFNTWYFFVGVFDGRNVKVYLNGNLERSGTATMTTNTYKLVIGRWAAASGNFWNGIIDEVRIYNRALTAEEIANIYRAGSLKPARTLSPAR